MSNHTPFAHLTADIIVLRKPPEGHWEVLLIQRRDEPFKDHWALPGGFLEPGETPEQAAVRELKEETSLDYTHVSQFRSYGGPARDPRGYVLTVVHYAVVPPESQPVAGDDAKTLQWWPLVTPPPMAFDHSTALADFYLFFLT